jgi:ribosomal-protein-alanine N-acetyltransferase
MTFIKRPLAKTTDDAVALIRKIDGALETGSGITWGITLANDDLLIGTIGFWRIEVENFRAEIGYLLDKTQQGKGLMSEAIRAVVKYGFEEINLHSIEGRVDPKNEASLRILEINGFEREGLLKENYFFEGKFEDSVIFSRFNTRHKLPQV